MMAAGQTWMAGRLKEETGMARKKIRIGARVRFRPMSSSDCKGCTTGVVTEYYGGTGGYGEIWIVRPDSWPADGSAHPDRSRMLNQKGHPFMDDELTVID